MQTGNLSQTNCGIIAIITTPTTAFSAIVAVAARGIAAETRHVFSAMNINTMRRFCAKTCGLEIRVHVFAGFTKTEFEEKSSLQFVPCCPNVIVFSPAVAST